MLHHHLEGFWIDEECLDKSDEAKHLEAINGMDVVYRRSRLTVGLLETDIGSKQDLHLLDEFLKGKYVEVDTARAPVRIIPNVDLGRLNLLVRLLQRILSDRWWQRCWIFQENHCSHRMMLLLVYEDSNARPTALKKIQYIGNDIQISAKNFQVNLTLLCLAAHHQSRILQSSIWLICRAMLKKARRYNILRQFRGWDVIGAENAPMSALIFADVCERDLTYKTDIPAIVANCCDYTRRIDTSCKVDGHLSLSLVLLALFLLNGDMLSYCPASKDILAMTVTDLLIICG